MHHRTLSNQFIGNIDEIKKHEDNYVIRGWVVPVLDSDSCSIGCEGFVSATAEEREDVFLFYKKAHKNYFRSGFVLTVKPTKEILDIYVNKELIFQLKLDLMESVLTPNLHTKPELIVVDNFYRDPDAVREYALHQEFVEQKAYHKGKRTTKSYIPSWIKSEFERYLDRPIKEFVGATGVFQYCTAEDLVVYHFDTQEYAAMVYLTPDAPLQSGTSTYKSKHTGLMHAATNVEAYKYQMEPWQVNAKSLGNTNLYDRHNYDLVDSVANVYNRMVIFNAQALHAATSYFGSTKENARLFHLFFFNC